VAGDAPSSALGVKSRHSPVGWTGCVLACDNRRNVPGARELSCVSAGASYENSGEEGSLQGYGVRWCGVYSRGGLESSATYLSLCRSQLCGVSVYLFVRNGCTDWCL
jgi:hypothetical protein